MTLPSQHSDDVRDWQRSKEASNCKYGHRDGPEQSDGLCGDRLVVPANPGPIVKGFDVLQEQKTDTLQISAPLFEKENTGLVSVC